jgi:hypothetical protein
MQLFPSSSIPSINYQPLPYSLFIQFIAIPHAETSLIAEDLDILMDSAYDEMWASCKYGELMYPGNNDDDELNAAPYANHCAVQWDRAVTRNSCCPWAIKAAVHILNVWC